MLKELGIFLLDYNGQQSEKDSNLRKERKIEMKSLVILI